MGRFGDAVKRLREDKRFTQDDLAQRARISRSLVQTAERQDKPVMRAPNYRAIAEALGLTVQQLDAEWKSNDLRVTIPAETADRIRAWMAETDCRDVESAVMFLIGFGLGATRGPEDRRRKSSGRDPKPPKRRQLRIGLDGGGEFRVK